MLNDKIKAADSRPTEEELQVIARNAYNDLLSEICTDQRSTPWLGPIHSETNLAFIDYYQRLADNGGHASLLPEEERRLRDEHGWDEQRIEDLRTIVKLREEKGHTRIRKDFIDDQLRQLGYQPSDMLRWMVELALYPAYRDAHVDAESALRLALQPRAIGRHSDLAAPAVAEGVASAPPSVSGEAAAPTIPVEWENVTATEAAERLIAYNPTLWEHRREGKREVSAVGEQTLRQIRWAAVLLERSMKGRPLWTLNADDLKTLDQWFDKLPTTCGKSSWHHEPETTLEEICLEAEERIENGECEADIIGFTIGTTNKHFRKLSQIHEFLRDNVPSVQALKFSEYITAESKDERAARAAYTVEQGKELFDLPPWVGCASLKNRLEKGSQIFHDALFFVLLLVWYTGMRREEVCKLLVDDVKEFAGIWHIDIKFTAAGRLKTQSSVRLISICDELRRLGFIEYVHAIRAAGHEALFPELVSERKNAKKGDTFYKLWWIYLKPLLPSLKRGQALHAARHMVDTELKELEVFPEFRDDALGHKGEGEGPSRYAKATRLKKLLEVVNQIPIVTDHLPDCQKIRLLPPEERRPRPIRKIRR